MPRKSARQPSVPPRLKGKVSVSVFEITKARLQSVPEDERALMLMSGHTLNLLGVWMKLLALTTRHRTFDQQLDRFNAAQTHILLRTLTGTVVEAWEWLRRPESHHLIRTKYLQRLPPEAASAYQDMKKMFGRSGLLYRVRNGFAYHHPTTSEVTAALNEMPDDDDFNWYVTDEHVTSFYFGCEAVVGYGAMRGADANDFGSRMTVVLTELMSAANAMSRFLTGLMSAIALSNWPDLRVAREVELPAALGATSSLPFFYERLFAGRQMKD